MSSPAPRDLNPPASADAVGLDLGAADDHVVGRRAALRRAGTVLGVVGVAAVAAVAAPTSARAAASSSRRPQDGPECLADLKEL